MALDEAGASDGPQVKMPVRVTTPHADDRSPSYIDDLDVANNRFRKRVVSWREDPLVAERLENLENLE